eukprot:TRINITY_DN5757_c0_g1_i1.p2 TRINITY_DN5757_c0_g1~~TRINITY_DN5757_c0_g1_i1.p2  ORF type:complete len:274 (-),score=77.25 TRINITY_DN5757_c0_g1_i1:32-790(-)
MTCCACLRLDPLLLRHLAFLLFFNLPFALFAWCWTLSWLTTALTLVPFFLIGVPLLAFTGWSTRQLAAADVALCTWVVDTKAPPAGRPPRADTPLAWIKNEIFFWYSWRTLLFFLVVRAPLAVASFCIGVVAATVPLALVGNVFVFAFCDTETCYGYTDESDSDEWGPEGVRWLVSSLGGALVLGACGVVLFFVGMAAVSGLVHLTARMSLWALAGEDYEVVAPLYTQQQPLNAVNQTRGVYTPVSYGTQQA